MQKACFCSFAQWQYHSQWGSSEAWLLLVENYTQYPAMTAWNMAGRRNLCTPFRGQYLNQRSINLFNLLQWKRGQACFYQTSPQIQWKRGQVCFVNSLKGSLSPLFHRQLSTAPGLSTVGQHCRSPGSILLIIVPTARVEPMWVTPHCSSQPEEQVARV